MDCISFAIEYLFQQFTDQVIRSILSTFHWTAEYISSWSLIVVSSQLAADIGSL